MAEDCKEALKNLFKRLCISKAGHEDFNEYHIEVVKDGHPLRSYLDNKLCAEYILMASGPIQMSKAGEVVERKTSEKSADETVESYEGSPLKLEVFATLDTRVVTTATSGKVVQALNEDQARELGCVYNLVGQELLADHAVDELLPFWVMCDRRGDEAMVYLGNHVTAITDAVSIKTDIVTMHDNITKQKLPRTSAILEEHASRAGTQNVQCECFASYDVLGSQPLDPCLDDSVQQQAAIQSSLALRIYWNQLHSLLDPPPYEANTFVDVRVVAGDIRSIRSVAHVLYLELQFLKHFVDGISSGEVEWCEEDNTTPLLDRVHTLLEELKRQGDPSASVRRPSDDIETGITRCNLDFTEHLWKLLKDCTSYTELVECWRLVFQCLHQGQLQPMVHKSNESRVACLVRDSYYGKMAVPLLHGSLPLELLAEIGMEKLQRDFLDALTGKDLVTGSQLQPFLATSGELSTRLELLEKTHYTLELISLLEHFLQLPHTYLSTSARQALKHYETHGVDEQHVFTVPVATKYVAHVLERCEPVEWRCALSSSIGDSLVAMTTLHLLTNKAVFPHIGTSLKLDESSDEQGGFYYTVVNPTLDIL